MKIAICDDEPVFVEKIARLIEIPDAEINKFFSGMQFLSALEKNEKFDIVFLDIEMPEIGGFDVARVLMGKNPNCILSFFTSFAQYSIQGYEFRAFRYILKTEPDSLIQKHITEAVDEYLKNNASIIINCKKTIVKIPLHLILYLESNLHDVLLYTEQEEYLWKKSFWEVCAELEKHHFIRCHKSYLINMGHIKNVKKGEYIVMVNGKKIPIGRKYQTDVINSYLKYIDGRDV